MINISPPVNAKQAQFTQPTAHRICLLLDSMSLNALIFHCTQKRNDNTRIPGDMSLNNLCAIKIIVVFACGALRIIQARPASPPFRLETPYDLVDADASSSHTTREYRAQSRRDLFVYLV